MGSLWLWLDVETTGLIDDRPAVLEAAWMITDDELRQLTPLRQRLTAIPWPPTWRQRVARWAKSVALLRRPYTPLAQWPSLLMPVRVEMMLIDSGLAADWARCEKIRDVADLDMAIHEDHIAALEQHDPGGTNEVALHLAGAGVAQFEARLFPAVESNVLDWCHYRSADTSVAAMVAGVDKVDAPSSDDGLELDMQAGIDPVRASARQHRAAADVRIAYRVACALREAATPPLVS
jgi:oligoribonuclease (3'-5' exoribonuclease)